MKTSRRQHVLNALNHIQPDKVPIDFGGHRSSGINPETYRKLRQYLGLPDRPIKVYDMVQQLAIIDDDVLDLFDVDTIELGRGFSRDEKDWKPWTLTDGSECLIPAYIDVRQDGENWVLYNSSGRAAGVQKPGMQFDRSSLDFTRDYLVATEEELARTDDVASFYYAMAERFPEANLNHLSNEMNANVFKGGRDWHWREEE